MSSQRSFFVGYLPPPPDVRRRALGFSFIVCAGFALLAFLLGATPFDVGASQYGEDLEIAGLLQARPYPIVVAPPDRSHPQGRAIMLGGEGKHGAQDIGAGLDGRAVLAKGTLVKRGDLDMLLVGGDDALTATPASAEPAVATPLGRWRMSGEICDGKCASGAMRPGTGLAHKACANLCISGGLPPVFVSTAPVEGRNFLLLADRDGGPAPVAIADMVGAPVTLEGEVERRGDLLIFRVDWSRATRL